ncbi:hypothetical protein B0T25DRAFT_526664 [Lasiosphaeria hispida]|uniref:Uncharacterized protein n=1 Tax=Lasiosphaeria hispida TaxID=260671 RepID=A0AAJ0HV39_9PEZI|nr:hypothetical protein B0T25DRAFT_526664 [Lasiosphaeria hispida]
MRSSARAAWFRERGRRGARILHVARWNGSFIGDILLFVFVEFICSSISPAQAQVLPLSLLLLLAVTALLDRIC